MSTSRRKGFVSAGGSRAGARHRTDERSDPGAGLATWETVTDLIAELAETHGTFESRTSPANWISVHEPGRRVRLETGFGSTWVQIDHIRMCWETLERRGRICRRDVLEPGRQSAFMMALFAHVPGVREEYEGTERALVLASERISTRA